jgi:hypothetical protein
LGNHEFTDSEELTITYILSQYLPYAQARVKTDNEERRKNAEIILHDMESILLKMEKPTLV